MKPWYVGIKMMQQAPSLAHSVWKVLSCCILSSLSGIAKMTKKGRYFFSSNHVSTRVESQSEASKSNR
jgi:hypothetical protein